LAKAATGPESVGAEVGNGANSYAVVDVPLHDSGFGKSNHPMHPNGRVVSGNADALAGESQSTGHVVKGY
jgi:hypothetical protein